MMHLEFSYPWILSLLVLPFLLRYFVPEDKREKNALYLPYFQKIQAQMGAFSGQAVSRFKLALFYAVWGLWLLAASGPMWVGAPIEQPREGRDIMLAVDISLSMHTQDMSLHGEKTDRLTIVKEVAKSFIDKRQNDRMGLVVFGSKAYLHSPLSFDKPTVKLLLDDLTPGLAGRATAMGDALGLSLKHLKNSDSKSKVLILLTDGRNNVGNVSPTDAAKMAKKHGIKVYTIGFGATEMIQDSFFGPQRINPSEDIDEPVLKEIAELTDGVYYRATDEASLRKIYQIINDLEPSILDHETYRPEKPLFQWPLAFALVLMSLLLSLPFLANFMRREHV